MQAERTKRANPDGKVFVYRNSVHAMPWFPTVRAKLEDPQYAGFFLHFDPKRGHNTSVPQCDNTYSPPLCTTLYHDQTQTPKPRWIPGADGS